MLLSVWDLWAHGISTSVYCLVDVAPPPFMFMSFNMVVANVPLDTCIPCCGQLLVDGLVVASSLSSQETLQRLHGECLAVLRGWGTVRNAG